MGTENYDGRTNVKFFTQLRVATCSNQSLEQIVFGPDLDLVRRPVQKRIDQIRERLAILGGVAVEPSFPIAEEICPAPPPDIKSPFPFGFMRNYDTGENSHVGIY